MGIDDELTIQFGDGIESAARTSRSIILMASAAIDKLAALGYERDKHKVTIMIEDDPIPTWVCIKGEKVFEISLGTSPDENQAIRITVLGRWLRKVHARGWRRFMFWRD